MTTRRPVACGWCGTPAPDDGPPLTWTRDVDARGERWLCERCTRDHVRDIEGKLDVEMW